uniref:Uncharacterized protein n=1 Tax=Chenopodium quinoa TaxID=63459 RepID=A0A803M736_CHEQI
MKQPNYSNQNNNNIHTLDERESYFSYILSPYKGSNHKKKQINGPQRVESAIKNGDNKKCNGDVDCEAEVFIRLKHKKLELSKTMSMVMID